MPGFISRARYHATQFAKEPRVTKSVVNLLIQTNRRKEVGAMAALNEYKQQERIELYITEAVGLSQLQRQRRSQRSRQARFAAAWLSCQRSKPCW